MISIAWISLPPETLQRLIVTPAETSHGRRWERVTSLVVAIVFTLLGMAASLAMHR